MTRSRFSGHAPSPRCFARLWQNDPLNAASCTTSDGKITLEHAECLAACDYAPVMTVNYEFFDKVDADSALDLVKQLQNGQRPQPTRGARLCTLKETAIQLAGFAEIVRSLVCLRTGEWPSRLKDVAETDVIEEQLAHSEFVDEESRKAAIERARKIDEIARQRGMGGDLQK